MIFIKERNLNKLRNLEASKSQATQLKSTLSSSLSYCYSPPSYRILSTPVLLSSPKKRATKEICSNKLTGPKSNPGVLHDSTMILSENLIKAIVFFFPSVERVILKEFFNLHIEKLGCFSNRMFT